MRKKDFSKLRLSAWRRRVAVIGIAVVVVASVAIYGLESRQDSSAAVAGWSSGGCCSGVPNGQFAAWRGEPVPIASTWMDSKEAAAALWNMDGEYGSWSGDLDVAIGAIFAGENWGAAASGAYDARWRAQVQLMRQKWGSKKTVYIRFAHEMNGTWYPWSVTKPNAASFRTAWQRYHRIVQEELVAHGKSAKMVLNFNKDPVNSATAEEIYPGNAYVDVIGVDFYDMYPNYPNQAAWDSHYMATKNGSPHGIGAWKAFAASKGKPLSFSEWGIHTKNSFDNPFYIEKMHQFFQANAGTGAGQVLYEIYFNTWPEIQIYPTSSAPNAAAKYRSLTWGGSGGLPSPSPVPPPSPTPVPPPAPTPTPPTPPSPAPSPMVTQTGNLLTGKTFISSVADSTSEPGNPAANITDKNEMTRWISSAADNATLTVDLGATYTLNKISILWAGDTVKNYDLQVSTNNTAWTTIASGTTNNTQKQLINTTSFTNPAVGRYFRIVAKTRWNASWGNSVWEAGVYGTAGGSANTVGDVNGDSRVNALDLSALISHDSQNYTAADFNGDGTVGAADMAILLSKWTW